jgi:hypothetical protein
MKIHKQFSFVVGTLRKLHENEEQQIENFSPNIFCYKNGNIFIEIGSVTKVAIF